MKWFNPEKKDLIVLCEMIIQILNLKKNVRKQKTQMGVEVSTT